MDNLKYIKQYLADSINVKQRIIEDDLFINKLSNVSDLISKRLLDGNKVVLAGNGGSAADSQHIAAEFVSRFFYDRDGLPAIALTTDTSILTAIGNDYGFDKLFSRQLQAHGRPGDIFIGISTSGNSENIVKAVECAKELNITSIVLCGESGKLKDICDIAICVPSHITPFIQESHICIGHIICSLVEQTIFPKVHEES